MSIFKDMLKMKLVLLNNNDVCVSINLCYSRLVGGAVQHPFDAVAGRVEHCRLWRRHRCSVVVGDVTVSTAVSRRHHSVGPRAVHRHAGCSRRRGYADRCGVRRPCQHVYWIHRMTWNHPESAHNLRAHENFTLFIERCGLHGAMATAVDWKKVNWPFDAHCCHEHYSARMSKITNNRLNPVWLRMLYSRSYMATVGVKGLIRYYVKIVIIGTNWKLCHCNK